MKVTESCSLALLTTAPAGGEYTKVPGTDARASSSADDNTVPGTTGDGVAQEIVGVVALLTFAAGDGCTEDPGTGARP